MRQLVLVCSAVTVLGTFGNCQMATAAMFQETQAATDEVSYARQVRPILQANCLGCHQPAKRSGRYLMTEHESLLAGGESGMAAIEPGEPDSSYLIELITPEGGTAEMPPEGDPLSETQIETIRRWIEQGAINDRVAEPVYDASHPPRYERQPTITSIDTSPDGRWIAVNGIHEVVLIDAVTGELAGRLIGRSPRIESACFSNDSRLLAVAGGRPGEFGELQIWSVEDRELLQSVSVTGDCLFGASWSPDDRLVAFGATDNTVRAIEADTGRQVLFQNVAEDWIRDTVFTADGSHLISVGRDMTCKLTEVATERFIDNITSITPGVLKGGISSVARHPNRDEIVVGTADGRPRLYRVFRETKRVIGDDANLIRQFPQMTGRVQSVAISPDGARIAAASSIDGRCEVRVYSYEFDTTVPDDIKAINSKVVTQRTVEEVQRYEAFISSDIEELIQLNVPDPALYSISFSADSEQLLAGGVGGVVHRIDLETGQIASSINPFSVTVESAAEAVGFSSLPLAETPIGSAQLPGTGDAAGEQLIVLPPEIEFDSPADYTQLVAYRVGADGIQQDVTAVCEIENNCQAVTINRDRVVESHGTDGSGALTVRWGPHRVDVPVRCSLNGRFQSDFVQDVNPILGKLGCNAGTCHGSQNGKNGFKLSLRGYDPIFDVRALTDELAARRVNIADPDSSLMLAKISGRVPHQGGVLAPEGSKYYQIIRDWIAAGAPLDLEVPRVERLTVEPELPVLSAAEASHQMRVTAHYSDGSHRDVTRECFVEVSNQEVAEVTETGWVTALRRGETAVLARYEGAFAATTLTVMGDRAGFAWSDPPVHNEIDQLVADKWQRMKIVPAQLCDDYAFLRRVHLDLTGLPPSPEAIERFIADDRDSQTKRTAEIDRLIGGDAFVDHWTNKWSDLLQVNEKFLGRAGAHQFHNWIRERVASNTPYDQFVRAILTSTGSNRENPAAAYYKILRTPEDIMENTTHLFLATRFNCNKCHDHPFERWTQDQYYQTAAYFAQVGLERDPESGDRRIGGTAVESATPLFEIVKDLETGEVTHLRTGEVAAPQFPFAAEIPIEADLPRREQFANWLVSSENPYFASSYVNRVWSYLLGVGLIEPVDDIRASNPPTNPRLLEYLTAEFVASGFDTQALIRLICHSRTYQLSSSTVPLNEDDTINYSHALPRRLPAEVFFDAMYTVAGSQAEFPGYPRGTRAAQLPNARLDSGLLATLGKPVRESACECERSDDLHLGSVLALVSGPDQAQAINDPENAIARMESEISDDRKLVARLYLRVLNRPATDPELDAAVSVFDDLEADHQRLLQQRDERLAVVGPDHEAAERERKAALEQAEQELDQYVRQHDPTLLQREADRQQRREELGQAIAEFESDLDRESERYLQSHWTSIQWHPLFPLEVTQTSGAGSRRLGDRSVMVTENNGPTTTRLIAVSDLSRVAAIRLEALAAEDLPSQGPGLADNGNFVLNEIVLEMAEPATPDSWKTIRLTRPLADFSQPGFEIAKTIDGKKAETGWAISPETGKTHWATFQLETPVAPAPGTRFRLSMIQQYGDARHQLGRFRVSFSPSEQPVGVSVSDELLTRLVEPIDTWSEATRDQWRQLVRRGSSRITGLRDQLADANRPEPVLPEIRALRDRVAELSVETPLDPLLARLEQDVKFSTRQLEQSRLTVAQDLAWALINSPEFLFNH